MRSLRQILLVAVTAIVAITAGRMLRDFVESNNAPSPTPSISVPSATPSPSPSGSSASA